MKPSKTKKSFYRRLYIAYLINSGVNTVPLLIKETGMPRRTAQDTIAALGEIGIICTFEGPTKTGRYQIHDWGPINSRWVKNNLQHVRCVLQSILY